MVTNAENTDRGAYQFVAIGAAPDSTVEAYGKAYQSGDLKVPEGPVPTAATAETPAATALAYVTEGAPVLPLLFINAAPTEIPLEQRASLKAKTPKLIEALVRRAPLLPGETITGGSVAVLGQPWGGLPAGTVVWRRETNRGVMAILLRDLKVDLRTGEVDSTPSALPPPWQPRAMVRLAVSDAETGKTIMDATLTIAQFAGFALGPAGLILSGGAAVLQLILGKLMSPKQVPLSTVVHDAVQDVLVGLGLQNANATIGVDYDWFTAHYNAAWADDYSPSDSDYKRFTDELEGKLDSDVGLVQQVELMMQPAYRDKSFPLFLLGASLEILMFKVALVIESSDKRVVDAYQYNALMAKLDKYIKYADERFGTFDKTVSDRLGKITPALRGSSFTPNVATGFGSYRFYWYWSDGDEFHYYDDTSGGCCDPMVQHQAEAQRDRDAHWNQVNKPLMDLYYAGDRDKAAQTLANWKTMRTDYAKYKPKSS